MSQPPTVGFTRENAPFIGSAYRDEIEDPIAELIRTERELQRREWLEKPEVWARERAKISLWSAQVTILKSVAQHRKTAVKSCHAVGKSFDAALAACWWLDAHHAGEAFVVTSAPSTPQIKAILWRDMGKIHARANLRGRLNQTEWFDTVIEDNGVAREALVAMGRKPDEYDDTAFQGIHAPFVLVIMDEACGIRGPLWDAADTLCANDNSRMLLQGNPDYTGTEFEEFCRPGSGYNVITIDAFSSPNFTDEPFDENIKRELIGHLYVEEKRKKWAHKWYWVNRDGKRCEPEAGVKCVCPESEKPEETDPRWQSKVLGLFPKVAEDQTLIPSTWIFRAQQKWDDTQPGLPVVIGQDVGGGGDESSRCLRRGIMYRVLATSRNPDTMQTCGDMLADLALHGASLANVDKIGIGTGIVNRAQELKRPVEGINVGESADDPEEFLNRRAELWWHVRTLFETGEIAIDPQDDDLATELGTIRFKRTSKGQIQIESKLEAKRRGIPSPNRAESLMLAAAPPRVAKSNPVSMTWGSKAS